MSISRSALIGFIVVFCIVLLVAATYIVPVIIVNNATRSEITAVDTPIIPAEESPPDTSSPPETEKEGPNITIKPFTMVVTSQGKPELKMRAVEAVSDQEKQLFTLNTIEEIRFFGEDNEQVVITADHGIWKKQNNRVEITGNVIAEITKPGEETVVVTCQWLNYNNDINTLTCGSDVVITRKYLKAVGEKLIIRPKINHLELDGDVVTTIEIEAFKNESIPLEKPVVITSKNLFYNGENKILQFSGSPVVKSGRNIIKCQQIRADLRNKNTRIIFTENCRMKLGLMAQKSGFSHEIANIRAEEVLLDMIAGELRLTDNIFFKQGDINLEASDKVSLLMDPNSSSFFGGNAHGNVKFSEKSFSGSAQTVSWDPVLGIALLSENAMLENTSDTKVTGDQIQLNIEDRHYIVDGNATIHTLSADSSGSLFNRFNSAESETNVPMIIQSVRLEVFESQGQALFTGGVKGKKGTFQFAADEMELLFDPETHQILSLSARNNITMTDRERVLTGGLFHYDATTGNAEIWKKPVMWKENNQLRADRFVYNENDQLLRMLDNVEAVAITSEGQEINLTGGNGTYDESNGILEFQDDVHMNWDIWKIRSNSLRIQLDENTGELKDANAFGDLKVDHESFNATGNALTYNPETFILVLTGTKDKKCQVTQGERGSQGETIKFFVNENRFVIEKGMSMIMPTEMTGTLE